MNNRQPRDGWQTFKPHGQMLVVDPQHVLRVYSFADHGKMRWSWFVDSDIVEDYDRRPLATGTCDDEVAAKIAAEDACDEILVKEKAR